MNTLVKITCRCGAVYRAEFLEGIVTKAYCTDCGLLIYPKESYYFENKHTTILHIPSIDWQSEVIPIGDYRWIYINSRTVAGMVRVQICAIIEEQYTVYVEGKKCEGFRVVHYVDWWQPKIRVGIIGGGQEYRNRCEMKICNPRDLITDAEYAKLALAE